MQNNIAKILENNPLIPVVTLDHEDQVDRLYEKLSGRGIKCVEITLRTEFAWDGIALFQKRYGKEFKVGVGTVISPIQISKAIELDVDFLVSPGLTTSMIPLLENSNIPFIVGVSTPSEIMRAMELGWNYLKFFPADIFGGVESIKSFGAIFSSIKFCPTGGIDESNFKEYLELQNVISVGGSWLGK
jgi:2-dehydro-3-deoxyphosphogluconate aldolase / (4S)-4-hydroxy-2-oxoglutarate aldolase